MISLFTRLKYRLPKNYRNVWYNQSVHISDRKYPVVFDSEKNYILPKVGLLVVMKCLNNGKKAYYKITKVWRTPGGDWLYGTDSINCNLKFSHIK